MTGWVWQGVDRWTRAYGDGVAGEVNAVAAGLYTGQLRRSVYDGGLMVGVNYGGRTGRADACDAVDALYDQHVADTTD